jgi:membrane protein DedA with SNARE-associated domain
MTFFRIFTFMGYSRALRASLMLGGITYYFMPDFSPGKGDDILFIVVPLLIIALRIYLIWRKERRRKIEI